MYLYSVTTFRRAKLTSRASTAVSRSVVAVVSVPGRIRPTVYCVSAVIIWYSQSMTIWWNIHQIGHRSYIQPTYLTQKNEYNSIVETEILHQPLLCRSSLPRNIPFACWFGHITITKLYRNTENIYYRRSVQHIDCSFMIEAVQSIFDTKIYHAA